MSNIIKNLLRAQGIKNILSDKDIVKILESNKKNLGKDRGTGKV